jgi:hypothetical protein
MNSSLALTPSYATMAKMIEPKHRHIIVYSYFVGGRSMTRERLILIDCRAISIAGSNHAIVACRPRADPCQPVDAAVKTAN